MGKGSRKKKTINWMYRLRELLFHDFKSKQKIHDNQEESSISLQHAKSIELSSYIFENL